MKVIYIAGPYRAKNAWEVEQNIRRAEELSLEVWRMGAACICLHTSSRFFNDILPFKTWITGDLEILRRCDAVLVIEWWESSIGANLECELARKLKIPIFEELVSLKEWLFSERQTTTKTKQKRSK